MALFGRASVAGPVISICEVTFFATIALQRRSIFWIYKWVEYAHFDFNLKLNERIKKAFLDGLQDESRSKIVAVFIEVDHAPVDVNEHSHHSSNFEITKDRIIVFDVVIVFPLSIVKLVSSSQIDTPYLLLPGQVLVDHKIVLANTNTNFGINQIFLHFINPPLEVKFRFLHLERNLALLSNTVILSLPFFSILCLSIIPNALLGYHSAL